MFGPKRGEVTREWRKLRNEKLYDLYSSPNAMRVYQIRKNKMNGAHSTWGRGEVQTRFWWRNLRERDHLEGIGVNEGNIKMDLQEVELGSGWN